MEYELQNWPAGADGEPEQGAMLLSGADVPGVSATAKIIPDLSLYLLSNVGQGHGSFTGDLSDGSYDLIGDPQSPGRMYAPTSVALTFGAKYNFRPNIYACLALAEQR